MGFDPRCGRTPSSGRPITANVDALLAENEALRQEVWALRQQVERLRQLESNRVSASTRPGISGEAVERWCQAMARHPSWATLRVGPPGGLRALVEELRRHSWNPTLSLEEELDRQSFGLGGELGAALRGPHSRGRWAVRAAFALYGLRAQEWLQEEPLRVVEELHQRVERLEQRHGKGPVEGHSHSHAQGQGQAHSRRHSQGQGSSPSELQGQSQGSSQQSAGRRRGTRTENHSQASNDSRGSSAWGAAGAKAGDPPADPPGATPPPDPRRLAALQLLGLEMGASPRAIKRAYWRLAKAHHPDLGGDPEAFHRLEAAYRLLAG